MNAKAVIRIGRKRQAAGLDHRLDRIHALVLGLPGELDDEDRVLGREAHQHHEADLREDVVVLPRSITPRRAESTLIGTMRMMASGSDQLSYCAASTRKTKSTDRPKM